MSRETTATQTAAREGPWNPGIESTIPDELRPLTTLLRPEHAFTSFAEAREIRGFTGLDYADIAVLRPSRLALHEVLIRVSAEVSVPDVARVEEFGIKFREVVRKLMARLAPRMGELEALYERRRQEMAKAVAEALAKVTPGNAGTLPAPGTDEKDPLRAAAQAAVRRVVAAVLVRHGELWGPREVMAAVATGLACNDRLGEEIGLALEPWLREAIAAEGCRLLPAQQNPLVMNTKGASASGKTSIRPLQRQLAADLGTSWSDFAVVSPDIWRKALLDYGSLGEAYKYAGAFTGEELRIVDQKLDRYMSRKAAEGRMPHLLIDRFRFDSFAPDSDEAGSNLLTRFGRVIYLFFMVTPPAALVERAWSRGLEVGRYKAVDDTLAHAVEAYAGMPRLFFTWATRADKRVHFEFLDNSVPAAERPATIALGWNDVLHVLDAGALVDIERFRGIDVDARGPEGLYRDPRSLEASANMGFLRECVKRFRQVDFAERDTGRVWLQVLEGEPAWADREAAARAMADADTAAAIAALLPKGLDALPPPPRPEFLTGAERAHTVGRWGPRSAEMR